MTQSSSTPPLLRRAGLWLRAHGPFLLTLAVLAVFAYAPLLRSDSTLRTHEDWRPYARATEYWSEFAHGYIPALHFPRANFGGGSPFPLFYPPLSPSLNGVLYGIIGDAIRAVHLSLLMSVVLSAWTFYLLAHDLTRRRWLALVGGILYITFPYRGTDIFLRGAVAESWIFAWYPMVLWGVLRSLRGRHVPAWWPIATAALVLSHTITTLYFALLMIPFALPILRRGWVAIGSAVGMIVLAGGLSSVYLLPATLLLPQVHASDPQVLHATIDKVTEHRIHLPQFFIPTPNQEAGASVPGTEDGISFFLGYTILALVPLLAWWLGSGAVRRAESVRRWVVLMACLTTLLTCVYMWQPSPFLAVLPQQFCFIQFPWRLLGAAGFLSTVATVGMLPELMRLLPRQATPLLCEILSVSLVFLLKPGPVWWNEGQREAEVIDIYTTKDRLLGTTVTAEYLPRSMKVRAAWSGARIHEPYILDEEVTSRLQWDRIRYDAYRLVADVSAPTVVVVPLIDYSYWSGLDSGGTPFPLEQSEGVLTVPVPRGRSEWTIYRRVPGAVRNGLIVSAISLVATLYIPVLRRRKRRARSLALRERQAGGVDHEQLV